MSRAPYYPLAEELKKIKTIELHIGEFLKIIADGKNPKIDEAIDAIISKINSAKKLELKSRRIQDENLDDQILSLIKSGIFDERIIAEKTNYSIQAIKKHLKEMIESGKIIELRNSSGKRYELSQTS